MTTHTVSWFESDDGKIFTDAIECMNHETQEKYRKSGIRFFIDNEEIENLLFDYDRSYNEMTDIYIDRTKEKENLEFDEAIKYGYGWSLVNEAIEGTGTHYRLNCDTVEVIDDLTYMQ